MKFNLTSVPRWVFYWWAVALIWFPSLFALRLIALDRGFFETHELRQTQTALTTHYLARGETDFLNYRSPLEGRLWNFTREMPIYQWLASLGVRQGLSVEVASRSLTLLFFLSTLPFLFQLFKLVGGVQVAAWALLLFLGLPFTTLYSRVSLIDIPAFAFLTAGTFCAIRYWKASVFSDGVVGSVLLLLAGLTKNTVWLGTAAALGCYALLNFKQIKNSKKSLFIFASLLIQLALVVAWSKWADRAFTSTGNNLDSNWIFGGLAQRFKWSSYEVLGRTFFVWVTNIWGGVAFVLGVILWPYRSLNRLILLGSFVFPILLFFNVTLYHDYYFIAGFLPILFFSSVGIERVFSFNLPKQRVTLVLFAFTMALGMKQLPAFYEGVLSLRVKETQKGEILASLTHPNDIILSDRIFERVPIAYHSNRLLLMIPAVNLESLEPSIFHIQDEGYLGWLSQLSYPVVYIESQILGTYVYRTKAIGQSDFNPQRHLAVEQGIQATDFELKDQSLTLDVCKSSKGFLKGKVKISGEKVLEVKFQKAASSFVLPAGPTLNLPGRSPWGCRVDIVSRDSRPERKPYLFLLPKTQRITQY